MKSGKITMALSAIAMAILIIDSRAAINYAAEGVELCIRTVIPSLFPFCVVGMVITSNLQSSAILSPLGRLFHIPSGTESIMLTGLLGGYPIGAQNVSIAFRAGLLRREEAERMLGFCSQPGPAFIFGILGSMFTLRQCWALWGLMIAGAWLVSLIFPVPDHNDPAAAVCARPTPLIRSALGAMGNICAWIVLMRIVIGFFQRWILWLLPFPAQCALSGILELTNGCCMLGSVTDSKLRFILAAFQLSLGGVCVLLQTVSLTKGLRIRYYLIGKLLQCAVCTALACVFQGYILAAVPLIAGMLAALAEKSRKNSSIPTPVGV